MNEELRTRIRLPFLLAFLTMALLVLVSFAPPPSVGSPGRTDDVKVFAEEPAVSGHAYLVRIAGSRTPILKRREWKRMSPASLTKLMTAVVAEEQIARSGRVRFSRDAKKVEEKTSSARPGDAFLRDDAVRMALVASYNDAALALAETAGKSKMGGGFAERISRFTGLMNEKAAALGLADTHFENPTGLDQDGHHASAEDLAEIGEYVLAAHPDLWEISRTIEAVVYSDKDAPHTIRTTNELLHEFPGLLGGKTGFTDRAQGALLLLYPVRSTLREAAAGALRTPYPARERGTAIIVILGSPDRFGDARKIIHWLDEDF